MHYKKLLYNTIFILLAPIAHSFTLNNNVEASFKDETITVNIASHTCQNISLTTQELLELTEEAINNFWNTVPTSRLSLSTGAIVDVSSSFQTESICSSVSSSGDCTPNANLIVSQGILISCNTDSTAGGNFTSSSGQTGGVLGLSIPNNTSGSTIVGAVVLLNDTSTTAWNNYSRDQQAAIIAHEIGHAIGLGHSSVKDSLMYYNTVEQRTMLGIDDIDGATYLYPLESPIANCGSISFPSTNSWIFLLPALCVLIIMFSLKQLIHSLKQFR